MKVIHVHQHYRVRGGEDAMVEATEGGGTSLMVGQTVRFQPSITSIVCC